MRKRVSRKMASIACSVFFALCIGIKAADLGQVPMNPFAKMSIQQIEREFDVKFVAALPSGTGTPATGTITPPPASGGMNQIPWNPSAISWVFEEKYPLARPHTLDIGSLRIEIWESPSYMEFSAAQLAVDHEARYLSDHNLLLVSPPVQESKADPQQIAEWCAGPKPAEDEQHRIANGWETLMSQWGQEIRSDYPDLHFVRAKPVTLLFRYDIHTWCWAAVYVVGLKNNRWLTSFLRDNPAKDATDLVMDAVIFVRQGTMFDTQLHFDGLRDAKGDYPGL